MRPGSRDTLPTALPTDWRKHGSPVLSATDRPNFTCPVQGRPIAWAAANLFNPGAVVHEGKVHVLFRAEDREGPLKGTSRIGLAVSGDGLTFEVAPEPVLFPEPGVHAAAEWPGGCEDPRVVRRDDGTYVMLYTAFNGRDVRLHAASSRDLRTWTKHGNAIAPPFQHTHAKAAAVVTQCVADPSDGSSGLVAARIQGRYWMYFGETDIFAARSDDLIRWEVCTARPERRREYALEGDAYRVNTTYGDPFALPVLRRRSGGIDGRLIEPGPPAVLTQRGIGLIYHAVSQRDVPGAPWGVYTLAQAYFDPDDPTACVARDREPFLRPDRPFELTGQSGHVCFAEGLVRFRGRWWLYYGAGDGYVSVATATDA